MKIKMIIVVIIIAMNTTVNSQDLISRGGANSWILHTPDNINKSLHLAPSTVNNTGWDWSKETVFFKDGRVSIKNNISVGGIITGTDFISGGSNSWIFHTPDDGRKSLYLAPRKLDNTDWDWSTYTKFFADGKVVFQNNISINGKIESKEVKVTNTPTADFVFETNYVLPSLDFIEKHIKEKKHLPQIASAKEMKKNGVNIGGFQIQLLQKIEELTLYTIQQQKEIKMLKSVNKKLIELQNRIERLESKRLK